MSEEDRKTRQQTAAAEIVHGLQSYLPDVWQELSARWDMQGIFDFLHTVHDHYSQLGQSVFYQLGGGNYGSAGEMIRRHLRHLP